MFRNDPIFAPPSWTYDNHIYHPVPSTSYLGVYIDHKLNWLTHLDYTRQSCLTALQPLTRLCHNLFGFSNHIRRIIVEGCISCRYLYCSFVFYHRIGLPKNRKSIRAVQRRCNIMCTGVYHTTNYATAIALCDDIPLDYKISKRSIL